MTRKNVCDHVSTERTEFLFFLNDTPSYFPKRLPRSSRHRVSVSVVRLRRNRAVNSGDWNQIDITREPLRSMGIRKQAPSLFLAFTQNTATWATTKSSKHFNEWKLGRIHGSPCRGPKTRMRSNHSTMIFALRQFAHRRKKETFPNWARSPCQYLTNTRAYSSAHIS